MRRGEFVADLLLLKPGAVVASTYEKSLYAPEGMTVHLAVLPINAFKSLTANHPHIVHLLVLSAVRTSHPNKNKNKNKRKLCRT
jgi:hypothetical protein